MVADTLIEFPPFRLDLVNQQLWREVILVPLRPKPFAVLAYLVQHAGRLVARDELVKAVWPDTYVSESLLRGYIREVRTALADDAEAPRFIETVARRGYRFLLATIASPPSLESRIQSLDSGKPRVAERLQMPDARPETLDISLVGRERELSQLHQWLAQAASGTRRVVFVSGEAGIGKTTLIDAFLAGVRRWALGSDTLPSPKPKSQSLAPAPLVARGQCIEHYGSGEAYLPVLEALGQLCRQVDGEQVVIFLRRYAPTWLVQMPALVSDAEFDALQRKVQGTTRERMLREMAEALEALTAERPLVLVIEDLHWSDHSTLDLLSLLAQRRGPARLLVLATYRPADVVVSGHPLRGLKQELQTRRYCEEIALGSLTTTEVDLYLQRRFPQHEFPVELGRIIHQSTEGNPLFMVNVVDEWIRQQVLSESDGQWWLKVKLHELAARVPESLRQMIERQLERLTVEEQRVLETASVIGAEFATATVAAGLNEQTHKVETWCEELAKRRQFLQSRAPERLADGTLTGRYGFLHALYPHVLYERLGTLHRVQLHRRIGEWEAQAYGGQSNEKAVELAVHFERGRDYARAAQYCNEAGQHARQRFATAEAARHFRHGLELLAALPETRMRQEQELSLLMGLSMVVWGASLELGEIFTQASALAQQLELPAQRARALSGLQGWHIIRGELYQAKEVGQQALGIRQNLNEPALHVRALVITAGTLLHSGELREAYDLIDEARTLYDTLPSPAAFRQYGQDPLVVGDCVLALILWLRGYPTQALQRGHATLQLVEEVTGPFDHILALSFFMILQQWLGSGTAVQQEAKTVVTAAGEYGSRLWEGIGRVVWGWSLVTERQPEAGWVQSQQGELLQREVAGMFRTYTLALLADTHRQHWQTEAGLVAITEALAQVEQRGERFWQAEILRLNGELTLQQASQKSKSKSQKSKVPSPQPLTHSPEVEAETCFLKAIAIAQKQHAKSLELRANMSLVRLRQQQVQLVPRDMQHATRNKLAEAHRMLSDVYRWFTEGFETKDLQEAKALLEALNADPQM